MNIKIERVFLELISSQDLHVPMIYIKPYTVKHDK
jgi:hypothetical protein